VNVKTLEGVRILDASHVVAGPFASYQLGLMGADVIRVDRIDGKDFVRHHGGTEDMKRAGLGASYICQNAGKSCIQINYKDPRGVDIFKSLAATADVVLENFRPGVMDRLGLGYDSIRSAKPDIVYCSLTGYGPDGPLSDAPAYDHIMQGVSGLMSTTGTPETGPLRSGIPITDYLAGLNAALAVLSALYHHRATGEGQHLQVSMLASALPVLGAAMADYQTTGQLRDLMGNRPFSDSPFAGRFDTSDGQVVVTANTKQQSVSLLATLGITSIDAECAAVTEGKTLSEEQKKKVSQTLQNRFAEEDTDTWVLLLTKASVPAGRVSSIADILANPQLDAIGNMDEVDIGAEDRKVRIPGLAFRSDKTEKLSLPKPGRIGQSTARVLRELGLNTDTIDELARAGIIAGEGLPSGA
jgi:crotonobetainyl-CoA:carnitine CoA-transferase CaiB-like acyl-CoA transferase